MRGARGGLKGGNLSKNGVAISHWTFHILYCGSMEDGGALSWQIGGRIRREARVAVGKRRQGVLELELDAVAAHVAKQRILHLVQREIAAEIVRVHALADKAQPCVDVRRRQRRRKPNVGQRGRPQVK